MSDTRKTLCNKEMQFRERILFYILVLHIYYTSAALVSHGHFLTSSRNSVKAFKYRQV